MQGMARKQKFGLQSRRPTRLNELKISTALASAINLVANQRVSGMRRMNADLMCAPGEWLGPQKGELSFRPLETPFHRELRDGLRPARINTTLQPDRRFAHFALPDDRRIDRARLPLRPASHYGEIFFRNLPALHGQTE